MSRSIFIRLSGWAMAAGGASSALAFTLFLISEGLGWSMIRVEGALEGIVVVAFFCGPVGVALGLLGARTCFGETVGRLGSGVLLLGAIGGSALMIIGNVVQALPNNLQDNGFGIFAYGLVLTFATLLLYGILALRRQPQPRWNGLAVVAGAPILLVTVIAIMAGPTNGDGPAILYLTLAALLAAMGAALVMFGYLIQSGEIPVSARPRYPQAPALRDSLRRG